MAVFCAVFVTSCTPPAVNNANAGNTNTNTTTAAAPTVDSLMAFDKAANEAWAKSDTKWFQDNLSTKFVMYEMGQRMTKDDVIKMIGSNKCDIKSMNLTEPAMHKINDDTYALTYKGTFDGTCTMDGKTEKIPTEVRAATVVIREGGKWMGAWHGETPIVDPKNPPAPHSAPADKPAANTSSNMASNSNSNSAAPAAPAKSANSDALAKLHQAGWEAFKNKDAKWFNEHLTEGAAFVDPFGGVHTGKANVVKLWTETMKCEGITKVNVTDAVATSLSPTAEILTLKGNADGTCDGQKNGDLYQTAVYIKEGDEWKLAFMFETLPMAM